MDDCQFGCKHKNPKENTANGLELQVSVAVTCSQRFCGIQRRKRWTDCCSPLLKLSRLSAAIYALYLAAKHAVKLSVHVSSCPACNWHWFWCVEIQCTISYNPLGINCEDKEGTVLGISWRPRDLQWAHLWEEFCQLNLAWLHHHFHFHFLKSTLQWRLPGRHESAPVTLKVRSHLITLSHC
jgi:hypothetical protein